jgi:YVTN family beta-propeller protein
LSGIVLLGIATGAVAAGPKAYVGNFSDSTVSVIDTATGSVVATVPVATGPHGMAITPDGRFAYVSGDGASTVTAIDTATDKVAQTIEVGKSPHGLAMTPEGGTLLVGVYGDDRVAFVDVATQKVVATVAVAKPHTIAMRPDGKVAYVASQEPGNFALVVVDVPGRVVLRRVALEKTPRDVEFGFDGKALYFTLAGVNAVQVLDPASDKIVAQVPTGASPHIANFYRGASAGTAVVQGPGELLLFNPETNAPLRSIAVGKQPHWEATADGKTIYVTNEGGNDVSIVDLATGKVTSVPVGKAPRKVVVQRVSAAAPAGAAKVSIANFAFAPATLAITAGESVTWSNDDGAPHGLAYKDGTKGIDVLLPGASFSRTYDKPGTFDYLCAVHPYMTGKVVVQAR